MNIIITGSSGLVGSSLIPFLMAGGHSVTRLVRSVPKVGKAEVQWDPSSGLVNPSRLEGFDAAIHLAGENIGARRWTDSQKAKIRNSRVQGTQHLCEALAKLNRPPKVLIAASAIGFYGDRKTEMLNEECASGSGFLAEICREWEAATAPALEKGIRVVNLRIGMILSGTGGALKRMLLPFQLGLGGRIGSGRQFMSWIAIDDLQAVIVHSLRTETLRGPINAVSPNPVTNAEFTKSLGRALSRPAVFPVPAFAVRLAFGEMANDLLLNSTRVTPRRLLDAGFEFQYPELEDALWHLLNKDR
jgi:uncharacterized protein (TIGR01777 family)